MAIPIPSTLEESSPFTAALHQQASHIPALKDATISLEAKDGHTQITINTSKPLKADELGTIAWSLWAATEMSEVKVVGTKLEFEGGAEHLITFDAAEFARSMLDGKIGWQQSHGWDIAQQRLMNELKTLRLPYNIRFQPDEQGIEIFGMGLGDHALQQIALGLTDATEGNVRYQGGENPMIIFEGKIKQLLNLNSERFRETVCRGLGIDPSAAIEMEI